MKTINSDKVKEILEEVNKAYDILEDDLSGDLYYIEKQIARVKNILSEIPHPDDIEQLENEEEE